MALQIIVNSALRDAAQLTVTNNSNAEQTPTGILNISSGPRFYSWDALGAGVRKLNYVNTLGGLAADTYVVTRASLISGHYLAALSYSTYPSAFTTLTSLTLSGSDLVGQKSQDYVASFSAVSNKQGLGAQLGISPTDDAVTFRTGKVYFGSAFTLTYPNKAEYRPLPLDSRFSIRRQSYLVNEEWKFTAEGLSITDVQTFQQLYKLQEEPLFVWDSTGAFISYFLLHGLLTDYDVKVDFNNICTLTFTVLALKQWTYTN